MSFNLGHSLVEELPLKCCESLILRMFIFLAVRRHYSLKVSLRVWQVAFVTGIREGEETGEVGCKSL